jgi:hypothetical protein
MKLLTATILLSYAIPALAWGQGFPNPREAYARAQANGEITGRINQQNRPQFNGARQVGGRQQIVIDPFAYPSAHQQMLERKARATAKRERYRAHNASKPVFKSVGMPPPDSDGYRVSNPLGTVYCGLNGCWR